MEDRNRRQTRNRYNLDREQYRDEDFYESWQAEQFEDGSAQYQGRSRPLGSHDSLQAGEGRYMADYRPAERDTRGGSQPTGRSDFGWAQGRASRSAGFSDDYYDNGLGAYDRNAAPRRTSAHDRQPIEQRGFFERAGDEVASWFGDEDAARRRQQDHRGKGPANYQRTDERILEDVCDRLTEDWQLDARNIQVTVNAGEVMLDGTVDDRGAKRRAEDIVEDVSGVSHVQNNLRVQPREADRMA